MDNIKVSSDYVTKRHGKIPTSINNHSRIFTSLDASFTIDRIFSDDNSYIIRVFRINSDSKTIYVDYISFSDIVSMFSTIDILSNHYKE